MIAIKKVSSDDPRLEAEYKRWLASRNDRDRSVRLREDREFQLRREALWKLDHGDAPAPANATAGLPSPSAVSAPAVVKAAPPAPTPAVPPPPTYTNDELATRFQMICQNALGRRFPALSMQLWKAPGVSIDAAYTALKLAAQTDDRRRRQASSEGFARLGAEFTAAARENNMAERKSIADAMSRGR
jgi:hypothetical protein